MTARLRTSHSLDPAALPAYFPVMRTEIYEADPFGGGKGQHLATIDSDYRFEAKDEFFLTAGGRRLKVRITHVRLEWDGSALKRELMALKL